MSLSISHSITHDKVSTDGDEGMLDVLFTFEMVEAIVRFIINRFACLWLAVNHVLYFSCNHVFVACKLDTLTLSVRELIESWTSDRYHAAVLVCAFLNEGILERSFLKNQPLASYS